jgi:hypothetical protein
MRLKIWMVMALLLPVAVSAADPQAKENWWVHAEFDQRTPKVIAVLPMDNLSLEPGIESILFDEVYQRLSEKGYQKISVAHVRTVMAQLGIQTPGQLAAISNDTLRQRLKCDAVLAGRIDQSASIHAGLYDAVVVSLSLSLRDLHSGLVLWQAEQWRTAHRQWQLDPVNALLNFAIHEKASREKRIAWLVHEMLKTLPMGPVQLDPLRLLDSAQEIQINAE